jgi:long-chain fatty acid transport protein
MTLASDISRFNKPLSSWVLGVAIALGSVSAHATNGYSPTGFGTINKGIAGAGVALPQDSLAAATNPAGMALVGHRVDTGVAMFSPSDRGFTADSNNNPQQPINAGKYTSKNDLFYIPYFGWNKPLSDSSSIGVSVGANGGMNTEYDSAVFNNFPGGSSAPTGVDFAQLFVGFTYAQQVAENHWLGVMPILAYQRFKAEGLEPFDNPFASSAPGKVTNNGYDTSTGYGLRLGWLGNISDDVTLGVSWQSRLKMDEFEEYAGLFAEQGNFDTPSTWVVGMTYRINQKVEVIFDFQRINYAEIKSLANANDINIFDPNNASGRLGADGGLGFGWKDVDIAKLGLQWKKSPKMTLRAGYSHSSKLFDGGQALFNILAPATIRDHFSFGGTYAMNANNRVNFAVTRSLNETIEGSNPVFTPGQTGSVEMEQIELELSWSHFF